VKELLYAIAKGGRVLHRVWVTRNGPMPLSVEPKLADRKALCGFRVGTEWRQIYVMDPGQFKSCRVCTEREVAL
jgi:hypothetical protein